MSKALIRVGYNEYVMDISDAVTVMEIILKAENYRANTNYNTAPSTTTYYIWGQEEKQADNISVQLLPETRYRVAKLAGRPEDK